MIYEGVYYPDKLKKGLCNSNKQKVRVYYSPHFVTVCAHDHMTDNIPH
jgi:hypothetical protein